MNRAIERLSSAQVKNAKPKGKLSDGSPRRAVLLCDGGGLYLSASIGDGGNIRRSWLFRYRIKGQRTRDAGLGSLNTIGLAEARIRAAEYRRLALDGIDPIRRRDALVARNIAAAAQTMSFDEAADAYIRQHRSKWRSALHAAQWKATLKAYVSPIIGRLSVSDIQTAHVLKVLNPIWTDKTETASRVRGRVEAVLGWAAASGFRRGKNGEDVPNPARWKDHLDQLLPSPGKVRNIKRQPSLTYADLPVFMQELRGQEGIAALALEFTILTCVRTADVRRAKRADVDRDSKVWAIREFSKTGKEHRVPLSDAALAVINRALALVEMLGVETDFIFPNENGGALSGNAMLYVLDRMGHKGAATTHGFRATFKTWAREQTSFPREFVELSLGHAVESAVEAAYIRGDALVKRAVIMQSWANFCRKPAGAGKVVVLQTRKA
jgi:integrase